jgi:hypothetical protein
VAWRSIAVAAVPAIAFGHAPKRTRLIARDFRYGKSLTPIAALVPCFDSGISLFCSSEFPVPELVKQSPEVHKVRASGAFASVSYAQIGKIPC